MEIEGTLNWICFMYLIFVITCIGLENSGTFLYYQTSNIEKRSSCQCLYLIILKKLGTKDLQHKSTFY